MRVLLAAAAVALLAGAAQAQTADAWKGVWERVGPATFDPASMPPTNVRPPYTPAWEVKYRANAAKAATDHFPDPITTCGTPAGFPRILSLPDTYEFVVSKDQTWILTENGPNIVRIYTDGRKHPAPEDMWPTYTGDSVGAWKDGVLTFDTIGVKGEPGMILNRGGETLSDKARFTTQLRKLGPDLIEAKITIEDPVALTRPWTVVKQYRRMPGDVRVMDYACAENNRNPVADNGRTLTLGTDGKPIDVVQQ